MARPSKTATTAKFVDARTKMGVHLSGNNLEAAKISQRETLEAAILNLATALGHTEVLKLQWGPNALRYALEPHGFMTATNFILQLTGRVLLRMQAAD